jgi:bacteriorhodopsin
MTVTALLVLVLVLIGALPVYPYSRKWGYYPSGALAILAVVVALMLLA